MKNARHRFYSNIVNKRIPDKGSSILVCGGRMLDKETFELRIPQCNYVKFRH